MPEQESIRIGLVSISDRASRGQYQDKGLPALTAWLTSAINSPYHLSSALIPDEKPRIVETLVDMVDNLRCSLVLTTGGTGPGRRDVTPEATLAVATREMPGLAEHMRRISLHFVPTAILSRQVAIIRECPDHASLILNLPGNPDAISQTLGGCAATKDSPAIPGIFTVIPYCVVLMGGPRMTTRDDICKAWYPG
ncbi:MAG: molybdopterin adenylyltransferase [Burkholderiaceae bacterium]|jgi:molybdopterin adenylyltransferase|nr:molybdopterin adenylyltransferase [Burkholderiaceae bacterium]